MILKLAEIVILFIAGVVGYSHINNPKYNQRWAWAWMIVAVLGLICVSFTFFA